MHQTGYFLAARHYVERRHRFIEMNVARDSGRRSVRVGQVVQNELSTVLRESTIIGSRKITGELRSMISIVSVDMSPDLRNAKVKVSIIGERKDKISAVRWLQGNTKSVRHALAKQMKGMKRCPQLTFTHVDVAAAVDVMVMIDQLSRERQEREARELDLDDAFFEFDDDELEADDELDLDDLDDFDDDDLSQFVTS